MIEKNKFYNGDSFNLIENIDNETIDLIVCDGPYGVTDKEWDKIPNIQEYNLEVIRKFSPKLKEGGAFYLFGKNNCIDKIDYSKYLNLRSKIIWYQPSRLAQGRKSYTNNYDLICYFIKGKEPRCFNLDAIRVPQLVELQHRLRVENVPSVKEGKYKKTKFNKDGKNPGDVWGDIKQLTYRSKELISREALNTIQKPEKLIERIVLASSNPGDLVLDPFAGVGTVPVICKKHQRNFIAFEIQKKFIELSIKRLEKVCDKRES